MPFSNLPIVKNRKSFLPSKSLKANLPLQKIILTTAMSLKIFESSLQHICNTQQSCDTFTILPICINILILPLQKC